MSDEELIKCVVPRVHFRFETSFPGKVREVIRLAFQRGEELEFTHMGTDFLIDPDCVVNLVERDIDRPKSDRDESDKIDDQ